MMSYWPTANNPENYGIINLALLNLLASSFLHSLTIFLHSTAIQCAGYAVYACQPGTVWGGPVRPEKKKSFLLDYA